MNNGKYFVARRESTYFLKMTGNLKYTSSSNLDSFLNKIFQEHDFENILIDLSETKNIDSTNLGLLAKISRWMMSEYNRKVTLISTNNNITELLNNLCLDDIFIIVEHPAAIEENLRELPHINESERKLTSIMLEAHQNLINLSEKNSFIFKNVIECLHNELNK